MIHTQRRALLFALGLAVGHLLTLELSLRFGSFFFVLYLLMMLTLPAFSFHLALRVQPQERLEPEHESLPSETLKPL